MELMRPASAADVLIIIAAFNEESVIGGVVSDLVGRGLATVVIDDGSRDRTGDLAFEAGASVVRHPINLGQGAALQTGIEYGLRAGYLYFVTFDADGQHNPDDIPRMFDVMARERADVVLGSRFLGEAVGMTSARRWLLKLAVIFTRLTSGLALTDAHNGLRAFNRRAAGIIDLRQNRMAHASEFLDQVAAARLVYSECPVTIKYTEYSRSKGQSGLNAFNILIDLFLQRLRK